MDRKRVQMVVGNEEEKRHIYLDEMEEEDLVRLKDIIDIHLRGMKVVRDVERIQRETDRDKDKMDRQIRLLSGEEDHE